MEQRPSRTREFVNRRLGLAPADNPSSSSAINLPSIVVWLLGLMIVVFLIQLVLPAVPQNQLDRALGFVPDRFTEGLSQGQPIIPLLFPLVSHAFVHGGPAHLIFNGLWMMIFGAGVARRMATDSPQTSDRLWNTLWFVVFFCLCGVAGALVFYVMNPSLPFPLVGASGAISGLMGGAMRFVMRRLAPWGVVHGGLAPITSRPVAVVTALYIGTNLMTALGLDGSAGMNIAWEAHIGGYLCGLLTYPVFDRLVRR